MLADFYVNHRNTFTEKLSHDNLEGSLKSSVMAFRGLLITFWLDVAEALDPPEQIALFDQVWFWKIKPLAALVGAGTQSTCVHRKLVKPTCLVSKSSSASSV
jgi:hypothetical protein